MEGVALVTGANSGIALAIVKALKDYTVIAHYHRRKDNLSFLPDKQTFQAEFRDEKEVHDLMNHAESFGQVKVLINSAAAYTTDFNCALKVNLIAPYILTCRMPVGSHIINISSIAAKYGSPYIAYASSKAGLEAMTISMAKRRSIFINTLRLGVVNTDLHTKANKDMAERIEKIPLKRMIEPEEVVKAVLFMINNFMMGCTVEVTGGE